jgi:very-short-patch-repair endonuclease
MAQTNRTTIQQARQLRGDQTPAERVLWSALRNRQFLGLKFRRQHPIGPYIVDFFCPERRLIIEVDGETHLRRESYDADRSAWLVQQGYHLIRFANAEVLEDVDRVLTRLNEIGCMETEPLTGGHDRVSAVLGEQARPANQDHSSPLG